MKLYLIPPSDLPDAWADLAHFIVRICDASNGKFLPVDIAKAIINSEFQLWAAERAGEVEVVFLGRIVDFPQRRVYEPIAFAGRGLSANGDKWKEMFELIEVWAKTQGCTSIQGLGSPGLERWLKPLGYKKTHVMLEKDL